MRCVRQGTLCVLAVALLVSACNSSSVLGAEPVSPPPNSGSSQTPAPAPVPTASDADTGPISVITFDPTCSAWTTAFADIGKNKFLEGTYPDINKLAAQTPHRVMRRLYEQENAYAGEHVNHSPLKGRACVRASRLAVEFTPH